MCDGTAAAEPSLKAEDLAKAISAQGIAAEIVRMELETPTVSAAAAALGVLPAQIIKSLVFRIGSRLVLVIACGDGLVSSCPLAARFNVGKKQVKLADAETVLENTGYPVGGVPPVCHRYPLPVMMDRRIVEWDAVYGGGGDDRTLLRISPSELVRATGAELVDLTD